jgi:antitoxin PrlF
MCYYYFMANIQPKVQSKITSQGQVSVPAAVRRALGIRPGSLIEWDIEGAQIVVKRAARATTDEVHQALFAQDEPTKKASLAELKAGIRKHIQKRHARA